MNKAILNQKITRLGNHLERNVQTFRGKEAGVVPKISWQQLVPVVVVLAGIGVLIASPRTRKSLVVKVAMLVSSQLLQGENSDEQI
jgi:hypothetical protein